MSDRAPWVHDENAALLTDLYQLTMLQAYWREGMEGEAVFSIFVRRLPKQRNYLVACGLDDVLRYLETVRFDEEALEYLSTLDEFSAEFLDWLSGFRFTGDVFAVPEGTPLFQEEPILEVVATIAQAQFVETFVMNQVHFQTLAASKAARVVDAAKGRAVVDFGLRRMHGADAGLKSARAFYVAGVKATSNVLAGHVYGIPVAGTMAHSYIQAHDREMDAFRAFAELYGETTLLVDTYDTVEGVKKVVELAKEMGAAFRVRGIRLDSGDLVSLAFESRKILDDAGLDDVEIFASGGLDEYEVAKIVESGAPITGFGVGTSMGVSRDAPALDIAYKLTAYAGKGRLKLSPGKRIHPGRKQIFRVQEGSRAAHDILAREGEEQPGRALLVKVMQAGKRRPAGQVSLEEARERAEDEIGRLPERLRSLEPADPPYEVRLSEELRRYEEWIVEAVT